ncbi:hypothetical protein HNR34_000756 [Geobacillus subterraneus]
MKWRLKYSPKAGWKKHGAEAHRLFRKAGVG